MTTTQRAVRKASRERLLRDFARAARYVAWVSANVVDAPGYGTPATFALEGARQETSRTRYACLMTAFGQ